VSDKVAGDAESALMGFGLGSLYQHYPGFEERMREALRMLLGKEVEKRVEMGLAKDGSGVGGASGL
jgi:hexokinase